MTVGVGVSSILVACGSRTGVERHYLPALMAGGWSGPCEMVEPGDPLPDLDPVGGLLVAGGLDIHPRCWDAAEPLHPAAEPAEDRDAREIPLVREAWRRNLPILGICRGHQILNVALGGSMIQHVPDHFACPAERHQFGRADDGPELRHRVSLAPGSRLAGLLGTREVLVNSRHHQAVKAVAPVLKAVGWHLDTVNPATGPLVEALEAEDPDRPVIGVQWHPENLVGVDHEAGEAARNLFAAFAEAVKRSWADPVRSSGRPRPPA